MTRLAKMDKVLIVGVGNPDRGDDALGPAAAKRLSAIEIPGVRVLSRSGDILTLVEEWRTARGVILIDAAQPQSAVAPDAAAPIHRIDVSAQALPERLTGFSTHGFGVAQAIELARALGVLPSRTIVYAIEGQCFDLGAPLSSAATASLDELTRQVKAEAENMAADFAGAQFF